MTETMARRVRGVEQSTRFTGIQFGTCTVRLIVCDVHIISSTMAVRALRPTNQESPPFWTERVFCSCVLFINRRVRVPATSPHSRRGIHSHSQTRQTSPVSFLLLGSLGIGLGADGIGLGIRYKVD